MKINIDTRFPYPVLSTDTGDYKQGDFSISMKIEETPLNGKLKIGYNVILTEKKISDAIANDKAAIGIFVTCLETYYNQLSILPGANGALEFNPGQLKGKVLIKPVIWATTKIKEYANDNLHEEYGTQSWDFDIGSLLAIGNDIIINVGHEKLAPMESIFNLAVNEEIPEGEIRVQTNTDKITIVSGNETYQTINNLRGSAIGKSILLNSVYLPVVMEVLSHLKDDEAQFSDKKWFSVFNAKCQHLNIDFGAGNYLEDAQKLLKSPISKIKLIGEQLS